MTLNELLAFRGTYKDSAAELIESLPRKKSDFLINKELDVISSCLVRERVCVCEDGVQHHTHCGKLWRLRIKHDPEILCWKTLNEGTIFFLLSTRDVAESKQIF